MESNSGVSMSYVGGLLFSHRSTCPAHLVSGLAVPTSTYRLFMFVDFRLPVISRQVSINVAFRIFAWAQRSHTGHAYSE